MAAPSFDEFYNQVKARLPAADDALIRSTYRQHFGADPVRTQGPTYETFAATVRQRLPDAPEDLLQATYQKEFGSSALTATKRGIKSGFAEGGKFVGALVGGLGADEFGQSIFDYWQNTIDQNQPATALQGNIVDEPGLLLKPAYWGQGLGGLAGQMAGPGFLTSGVQRGAEVAGRTGSAWKGLGVGALETVLNLLPLDRMSGGGGRLATGALFGLATGAPAPLEALATGDDMGEALKQGASAAPFGMVMGAALGGNPAASGVRPAARTETLARAQEAAQPVEVPQAAPTPEPAPVAPERPAYFNEQDIERLAALPPETRSGLEGMYRQAAEAKPALDAATTDIAREVGGVPVLADLKGTESTIKKIVTDYRGDSTQIRDLARTTIQIDTVAAAMSAVEKVAGRFEIVGTPRNLFDQAIEPADGYRDAKFNVRLPNGHIGEIQINMPAMLEAKAKAHPLYKQRTDIERKIATEDRLATPEEQAQIDSLNAQQRAIYVPAWTRALEASTSFQKAASETGEPLRRADSGSNGRVPGTSQAAEYRGEPGTAPSETGIPSTSKNSATNITSSESIPARPVGAAHELITAAGRKVDLQPQLVELADLKPSDHPDYPAEVQPRQRDRAASQNQIDTMARDLSPQKLRIIVSADGVVESGNGRTMAVRRAAQQYPEQAARYRAWLEKEGYDTSGMKFPVLVQRRMTELSPADRAEFAREMNVGTKLAASSSETALNDARLLDSGLLAQLQGGDVGSARNAGFVRSFIGKLRQGEQGGMLDPDGALSSDGIRRINNAVMAKAYGGTKESNAVLTRALESADNDVRSATGAMLDAAPAFADLRAAIADQRVAPELDVADKLARAVQEVAKMRQEGRSLEETLRQADAFNPRDPVVDRFMRALYQPNGKRAAGREAIAEVLSDYANRAMQQRRDMGDLFGGGKASPVQILDAVLAERGGSGGSAPAQGRLVADPAANYKRSPTAVQERVLALAAKIPDRPLSKADVEALKGELVRALRTLLDSVSKADDQKLWQELYDLRAAVNQGSLRASKKALLEYAKTLEPGQAPPTRAYAGKRVVSRDGQLAFDFAAFETRPDTTARQTDLGRAALSDLISDRDRRAGASVLADGLTRDFTQTGTASLIGQTARTVNDMAALVQVFRDPRFETLRFILMKGSKVVDHYGATSRLPGAVKFEDAGFIDLLRSRMRDVGADGYYLQHNHPSGTPDPSYADEVFTQNVKTRVEGLRGHVIVDHNAYSTISPDGEVRVQRSNFGGYDPEKNPRVAHHLLERPLQNDSDLAVFAKKLQAKEGFVTLLSVNAKMRVKSIVEFPADMLTGSEGLKRIERMEIGSGGGAYTFAVGGKAELTKLRPLLDRGLLADAAVTDSDGKVSPASAVIGSRAGRSPGSVVGAIDRFEHVLLDEPPTYSRTTEPVKPGEQREIGGGNFRLMQFANLQPNELVTLAGVIDTLDGPAEAQRRGTRSWDATEEAALKLIREKYGITLDQLVNRRKGSTANAEQLEAYAQILAASTRNITELAAEVRATNSNEAKLALAAAKDKLGLMLAPALGYQSEAGRALNILRKTAKDFREASVLFDALGDGSDNALTDFADRLGMATNPDQVIGLTRAAYTPTHWDKFYEYWINGLLSGPTTHAVNMSSNALFQSLDLLAESAAALLSKDVALSHVKARVIGQAHGIGIGLKNAGRAFQTEQAQIGGQRQMEAHQPAIKGKLGRVIRLPSRALLAEDEFFKSMAYHGELASIAMRRAMAERPTDLKARFNEILGNVMNDPQLRLEARKAAERATFQTPLGPIGQTITHALNKSKVGRIIVPFIRTPTNILKRAVEYTPAGYSQAAVREAISRGGRDSALAYSRMAVGSGIMLSMVGLAAAGLVTGNGPEDPAERALLMRQGWQPYSLKVGDRWVRYNRFDPVGTLMGVAADLHDIGSYASADDLDKVGSMLMTSIALNLGDKTFLRGITDFASAYADPQRYLARWAQGLVASLVPNIAAQSARGLDPYMRESRNTMDAIRAKIPFEREKLARKLDIAGEPVDQSGDLPGNPLQASQRQPDALADAMLRLDLMKGKPGRSLSYKSRQVELEEGEYESYAGFVQQARWRVLTPLVRSPQFRQLMRQDANTAQRLLEQQWNRIGDQAKAVWLFRNPSVISRLGSPRAEVVGSAYADTAVQ